MPKIQSVIQGEGNYMPVKGMVVKWKQFDKLQQLEVSSFNKFHLFCVAEVSAHIFIGLTISSVTIYLPNPLMGVAYLKTWQ